MSLARKHRDRVLAQQTAAAFPAIGGGLAHLSAFAHAVMVPQAAAAAAAQISMRLTHDRRRLKEIQSLERKIEAKREMLPAYASWIEGLLAGEPVQDEVLPTIMIWHMDVGDWQAALPLAAHVLRHKIQLPAHFQRDAPTLILEQVAEGALKAIAAGDGFDLDLLEQVEILTADEDMPDEARAKLHKAIGLELVRQLDATEPAEVGVAGLYRARQEHALRALRRARELNDRCGVTQAIAKLERALAKADAPPPSPPSAG